MILSGFWMLQAWSRHHWRCAMASERYRLFGSGTAILSRSRYSLRGGFAGHSRAEVQSDRTNIFPLLSLTLGRGIRKFHRQGAAKHWRFQVSSLAPSATTVYFVPRERAYLASVVAPGFCGSASRPMLFPPTRGLARCARAHREFPALYLFSYRLRAWAYAADAWIMKQRSLQQRNRDAKRRGRLPVVGDHVPVRCNGFHPHSLPIAVILVSGCATHPT